VNVSGSSQENESADRLTFEQALAAIEWIVHELEEGQLGLEESLARYERGAKLLRQCHEQLHQAERRIELLAGVDAAGNPVCTPLDETAATLEEKARQRSRRRSTAGPGPAPNEPGRRDPNLGQDS
jgi:exodeoxyribonuclease VII small subunit